MDFRFEQLQEEFHSMILEIDRLNTEVDEWKKKNAEVENVRVVKENEMKKEKLLCEQAQAALEEQMELLGGIWSAFRQEQDTLGAAASGTVRETAESARAKLRGDMEQFRKAYRQLAAAVEKERGGIGV